MTFNEVEVEILGLIEKDSRISMETIAKMVNKSEQEVEAIIRKFEELNVIVEYNSIINWRKVDGHEGVTAMIDVKVAPKRGVGFDAIAERIYRYPEVKSVYLMSGAYDLSVVIEGKSMSEVGNFVSDKLSTLDSVLSTTTHFVLKKYKHDGTIFDHGEEDKRIVVSP
ncbi:Lrp/AsnC family transcriptional regulator [Litchfieldia salsa]|uniref:DNA-binding transcriptional regulator, Lrp family n=1 Tax=Litchfieldia salsa TaxID=930152 RepID=A0A1H0WZ42_9BACI|nr:Lrp/AsnC family transcriptional regulator [Litchfieldia salsa]SDP95715.1 DNA-binding transcriptional regulator, Lrp family [Litchfieldia salsa]